MLEHCQVKVKIGQLLRVNNDFGLFILSQHVDSLKLFACLTDNFSLLEELELHVAEQLPLNVHRDIVAQVVVIEEIVHALDLILKTAVEDALL